MKKAILFASFGVINEQARKNCIDAAAKQIEAAFPEFTLRQAYTSVFIRKKLAEQGVHMDSLSEALDGLLADGFTEVIIQPGYLTAGEEYEKKVLQVIEPYRQKFARLLVSRPLMECPADGVDMLAALQEIFPLEAGEDLVLVGHGSPHQHNPAYENLQADADKAGFQAHLARLQAKGAKNILLAPLLLSGGAHVNEDIAGAEAESWLSRLQAAGFSVRVSLKGLGEYPAFQKLYVKRLQEWDF